MGRPDFLKDTDWTGIEAKFREFYGHLTFRRDGEAVEQYGAAAYSLDQQIPSLERFWQFHVAPATDRSGSSDDTLHLAPDIHEIIGTIAGLSYEVFCELVDAKDAMKYLKQQRREAQQERPNGDAWIPGAPRYRQHLNVLLFSGDAVHRFGDMMKIISVPHRDEGESRGKASLLQLLGISQRGVFPKWATIKREKETLVRYRTMLVHHARPWLCFEGKEHATEPLILKSEFCRDQQKHFVAWHEQQSLFNTDRTRFHTLSDACEISLHRSINWLKRAYQQLVEGLEPILPLQKYRDLYWGHSHH